MYALVRFVEDQDNKLHIIRASTIADFEPVDEKDFDSRRLYRAYWCDDKNTENSGYYPVQILMLAETEEKLEDVRATKRVPRPKLWTDESRNDESTNAKKNTKQAQKRKHEGKAKKEDYDAILEERLGTKGASTSKESSKKWQKKKTRSRKSSTESDVSDDYLVSSTEVLALKEKNKRLTRQQRDMREEILFLREEVRSLQRCLESRMLSGDRGQAQKQDVCASAGASGSQVLAETPLACVPQGTYKDFSYTEDGSFHLSRGIVINRVAAGKIFADKKPTVAAKDIAQAVWGREVLMTRSVSGQLPPKQRHSGMEPKQPLTPEKVDIVTEALRHWGDKKGIPTDSVVKNLTRVLSEKIQDLVRQEKKSK
ncbi:BEN domain-containing protein 5-like [Ornithodoros turicata]|uniref:BEN domain-containing protein 5-like n=1 Tax=Ornithodoros turicata TaxID=34597 RepID=UPI003138CF88